MLVRQASTSSLILPNFISGLLAGLMALTSSVSYAALIFAGGLEDYLFIGISIALISASILSVVVALVSSFPFASAGPDSNSSVLLALMSGSIIAMSKGNLTGEQLLITVWVTISLCTILTGVCLFLMGKLHLGQWVRYVPYPVVGGFLAGTGWLLVSGSFLVMTGISLELFHLKELFQKSVMVHWLPGVFVCLLLLYVPRRIKHYLVMPTILVGAVLILHLCLWLAGITHTQAINTNWLFEQYSFSVPHSNLRFNAVLSIDWHTIAYQGTTMAALFTVVVLSILLNSTGVELETKIDCDLDRELRANGIANILSGLGGGIVGYISVSRSLLLQRSGATNRLSGITAGLFCFLIFLVGMPLLSYLPKPVLAGFLLYIGMDLLIEWTVRSWYRLPRSDYCIIILIAIVIGVVGFVEGVIVGIMASVALFVFNYSRIGIIKHESSGLVGHSNVVRSENQTKFLRIKGDQIYIIKLQNVIFFGTAHSLTVKINHYIETSAAKPVRFIILDFSMVSGFDSSTVLSFIKLKQLASANGITLLFISLKRNFKNALIRGGILDSKDEVVRFMPDIDRALEWCEENLLSKLDKDKQIAPIPTKQVERILGDPVSTQKFISFCRRYRHPEGYVLFREGDAPDGLYILGSGQVSVRKLFSDGSTKRLRTYKDGTVLGEMGLYSDKPRSAYVIADKESYFYFLSKKAVYRMEKEAPEIAIKFHRYTINLIASRLKHFEEQSWN